MPGSAGFPIIAECNRWQKTCPDMKALDVLDHAMRGHEGSHPDFECTGQELDHWTDPPSPFAELLREAFDPAITQQDLQLMVTHTDDRALYPRIQAVEERWQKVIDAFGERYNLWSA